MYHNTYQPPANFPQQDPQPKYPQVPPMNYGQVGMSPAMTSGQVGVNLENAHLKLLLQNELKVKEADLGSWGCLCKIWFLFMTIWGILVIFVAATLLFLEYVTTNALKVKYAVFFIFWIWFVVQSILTIANVGSKDAVGAKKLWISLICFAVMYPLAATGTLDDRYDPIPAITTFLYVIPVGVSLLFTGLLKNLLEKREELVQKLKALSVINP